MELNAEYRLIKHLGKINEKGLELNIIGWDHKEPTFDIRGWSEDHETMTSGLSLTESEMDELVRAYTSFKATR